MHSQLRKGTENNDVLWAELWKYIDAWADLLSSSSVEISDDEVVDFVADVASSAVEVVVDSSGVVVGDDAGSVPVAEVLDVSTPVDVALLSVLLEVQSVISFSILSTNEVQENLGLILLKDNKG